ncbi:MAG: carboxylesterase/lipase family protein [Ilumatobacter sp.]|uniref:carboxylesterase/lipase family protein n=1 Tax=Ilumatobacter sp. TaxID=1967498 RepID=UPI00329962EF
MEPRVKISNATLRGNDEGGHLAFLGVPYAIPPVGDRRFRAPEPSPSSVDVVDATTHGHVCPQDPFVPSSFRASGTESEDCLTLDVRTPACDDRRRPVMFWIHGGGFSHGAGSQPPYHGGPLAERGDVVVVNVNYRLGALGYLYLGGHAGDTWGAAANVGQLDQITALRWVRDNIEFLGGDPGNITIFGQSAGAAAVATLMAMPAARGLFHKAIAQSGTANRLGDTTFAGAMTGRFLERLGVVDADPQRLRSISVPELLRAQGPRGPLSPVIDGDSLPDNPLATVRRGDACDIPLMVGTARDEQKLYVRADRSPIDDGELARQITAILPRRAADRAVEVAEVYRESRTSRGLPATAHDIVDAVATASRFRFPAVTLAEAQLEHQGDIYLYQVDWESPARGGTLGACHGVEITLVFGTVGIDGNDRLAGSGPDVDALMPKMMDAWIAFARTGSPGHEGIGPWPAYDTDRRATMIFDRECRVEETPFEEERAVWASMVGRH